MSCKVSFIGLGVMGYPMAGFISKAGHNVTVYNRTKSKAEKWIKEYKGNLAETPMEAAKDCDYIFTCVGNDNDLRDVTLGEKGLFKTAKKGSIYIDNTTASANIARERSFRCGVAKATSTLYPKLHGLRAVAQRERVQSGTIAPSLQHATPWEPLSASTVWVAMLLRGLMLQLAGPHKHQHRERLGES